MKKSILAFAIPLLMAGGLHASEPEMLDVRAALQGRFITNNSPAGVTKEPTTFRRFECPGYWYGCFDVTSSDFMTVLGSWHDRTVVVEAPYGRDSEGWTMFRMGTYYRGRFGWEYSLHDARL